MSFSLGDIKKFLHSDTAAHLARKALGVPDSGDNEAPAGYANLGGYTGPVIKSLAANTAPDLPPPVRTVTTSALPPPIATAPSAPLPPPVRNSPDVGAPPPPADPGYITNMEQVRASMQPRMAAMPPPVDPIRTDIPGQADSTIADPGRTVIPAPVRRVPTGPDLTGMTASQRAGALADTLQITDPQSKVRVQGDQIDVAPPQKLSRLKAAGKMFLQRMMAGSPYGLGGMLGAGIEGSIEGGVAPGHAQKVLRQGEVAKAQGDQYQAQTLEQRQTAGEQQAVNLAQDKQATIDAPIRREEAKSDKAEAAFERELGRLQEQHAKLGHYDPTDASDPGSVALKQMADDLSARFGRKVGLVPYDEKTKNPKDVTVDGQIVRLQPDGTYKPVYGQPKSDDTEAKAQYEWSVKAGEATAKRAAEEQQATAAESLAGNYQQKVNEASAKVSTLDSQMAAMPATIEVDDPNGTMIDSVDVNNNAIKVAKKVSRPNPELGPLKRQREQFKQQQQAAQKGMEDAYRQRDTHRAKMSEYVAPPPPPTRTKNSPGQAFSKSAWRTAHPGGDLNAAIAEANRRQLPIVD